jgi:phosphomannomutase
MILAVNAAIGGEGTSGGIIFPAVHLCRDSYSGIAMFLDRMARTGQTISQLAGRLPRYYRKIGKVPYEHGQLGSVMQQLEDSFPDVRTDRSDGLKLMWPDRWIHVRASNTEPILRFSAEARTVEEMESLYQTTEQLLR